MLRVDRADAPSPFFRVAGELDLSTVDQFLNAVEPVLVDGVDVVFDLSQLRFMDSSGIHAFVRITRHVGPHGRLRLRSPSSAVVKVLDLVGVQAVPGLVIEDR